jgi:hypothetical protein
MSSPIWGSWPDIYYCLTATVLFLWGALSEERTGLSFVYADDPCQRSLSRIRVLWDSRLSDLRLPFSSPPTTRGVTVELFDPASTWFYPLSDLLRPFITPRHGPHGKHRLLLLRKRVYWSVTWQWIACRVCLPTRCLGMGIHFTIHLGFRLKMKWNNMIGYTRTCKTFNCHYYCRSSLGKDLYFYTFI